MTPTQKLAPDQNSPIIVTGIGGPAGSNTSKFLQQAGYHVIGTDMRHVDANVDEFRVVPAADHPDFASALQEIIRSSQAALLIPTVSEELPIMAQLEPAFGLLGCRTVIAPYAAVITANDKFLTAQRLEQYGVAVPKTLTDEANRHDVVKQIGLPLIAKPRISRGGRGVVLYHTAEELQREDRTGIVFQQFMPSQEYDVNLYIDRNGKMRACVVLRKTQLKQGMLGNALAVERTQQADIAALAESACAAIGLTGPADMDIRMDAEGKPRILEINARLGANVLSASEVIESLLTDYAY